MAAVSSHLPTTLEELIAVEKPVKEEAISLGSYETYHKHPHDRSRYRSLARVIAIGADYVTLKEKDLPIKGRIMKSIRKDLRRTWRDLNLESLVKCGITPIIAGGWVEHHVLTRIDEGITGSRFSLLDPEYPHVNHDCTMNSSAIIDEDVELSGYDINGRDVDVFLCYTTMDALKAIHGVSAYLQNLLLGFPTEEGRNSPLVSVLATSRAGYSFAVNYPGCTTKAQVQLLPSRDVTPLDVINAFDLDCCCAYFDGKEVYALPRAIQAWETKANVFRPSKISSGYEQRVIKYGTRHYDLLFPMEYHAFASLPLDGCQRVQSPSPNPNPKQENQPNLHPEDTGGLQDLINVSCSKIEEERVRDYLEGAHRPLVKKGGVPSMISLRRAVIAGRVNQYSYFSPIPIVAEETTLTQLDRFLHGSYDRSWLERNLFMGDLVNEEAMEEVSGVKGFEDRVSELSVLAKKLHLEISTAVVEKILCTQRIFSMHELFLVCEPITIRSNRQRTKRQITDWFCRGVLLGGPKLRIQHVVEGEADYETGGEEERVSITGKARVRTPSIAEASEQVAEGEEASTSDDV